MTRSQRQNMDAYAYEAFMTRAFRTERNHKNGFDAGEFQQLEYIENGYRRGITYTKQMQRLSTLLGKAVAKVLSWKLTLAERAAVLRYAEMIEQAGNGDELAFAIAGLNEITRRFKVCR